MWTGFTLVLRFGGNSRSSPACRLCIRKVMSSEKRDDTKGERWKILCWRRNSSAKEKMQSLIRSVGWWEKSAEINPLLSCWGFGYMFFSLLGIREQQFASQVTPSYTHHTFITVSVVIALTAQNSENQSVRWEEQVQNRNVVGSNLIMISWCFRWIAVSKR